MAGKKIVVADSDARRRRVTATLLKLGGYEVIEAARLAEVADAGRSGVDALVTEAELSDGDAIAYAARLRAHPSTARLPIIVATTDDSKRDAATAALGPDAFLALPYRPTELYERLARLGI
ncbi:MAG TPA: response regulator [Candidatus Limnocylindria bacterium]|nr:response regulator [Candidatus Limnocylindria bacterium]